MYGLVPQAPVPPEVAVAAKRELARVEGYLGGKSEFPDPVGPAQAADLIVVVEYMHETGVDLADLAAAAEV